MRVALVGLNTPGYSSLGLAYVRAAAHEDSRLAGRVQVTTLDLTSDDDPWWVAYRVLGTDPDVVAFSVMCWNARKVYDAAEVIKAARPEIRVVLGGPEVGASADIVLGEHPSFEAIVRGEGEHTFTDLVDAMRRGRNLRYVDGLTFRAEDRVLSTPDRPLANLDELPSPYLLGMIQPTQGSTYLETFRGCPHRCAYCFEGKGYEHIRTFSKERVVSEIESVVSNGVTEFSFIDAVFNLNRDRLRWMSDLMAPYAARGVSLHTIEVDIERIDDDDAGLLHRAGVRSVETGPQTTGAIALANCERGFDKERFIRGVRALRAAGISVECDLIIGLPGDTVSDVLSSIAFVLDSDPGKMQMSTLCVLPGTALWDRAEELGLVYNYQPPHEVIRTREIDFTDLRRLEAYGSALAARYRARL